MDCTVRPAQGNEGLDALKSKGVAERLSVKPSPIINGLPYIVNERMLLILFPLSSRQVEAHIAEPKKHWTYIHDDIKESLIFIQSLGYNQVYTNVRSSLKTTLNLLKKHGFEHIDTIESEVILKWASKQHF